MPHESQVGSLLDRVPISISITFSLLLFLLVYFSSKPILFPHFFLPFGFLLPWFLLNVPQFFLQMIQTFEERNEKKRKENKYSIAMFRFLLWQPILPCTDPWLITMATTYPPWLQVLPKVALTVSQFASPENPVTPFYFCFGSSCPALNRTFLLPTVSV